jgi:hypothetical protein
MLLRRPASLDGSLLARKGEAAPSLFGPFAAARPVAVAPPATAAPVGPRIVEAAVRAPREQPARRPAAADERVAVKVRLDSARYLKLKAMAANTHRTSQSIIEAALDDYISRFAADAAPDCACLRKGRPRDLGG